MTNFYIDSADRAAAEPLLRSGLVRGITTNPTLLRAAGVRNADLADLVGWATEAGAASVFVQAWGADSGELERRGRDLHALHERVVVKLPVTAAGLTATRRLQDDGIAVLVTAVYGAPQVMLALAAGATYVAPYLGRMTDAGRDGMAEIAAMQRTIEASGSRLRILVASLRSPQDAQGLAQLGVRDFTVAPPVWDQFFADPLTARAVTAFDQASAAGD